MAHDQLELVMDGDGFIDVVDVTSGVFIDADRVLQDFQASHFDVGCEFDGKIDAPGA